MRNKNLWVISLFIAGIFACNKGVIDQVFTGFKKPNSFPTPTYHFETNPITQQGFELGRKLFYDPILSTDLTISCGSCHIQTSAFTQHGHSVSHGVADRLGTRNSPPIMNLAWHPTFMWDGGIFDLDLQPIAPITSHVEMDDNMPNILSKLRNQAEYPKMFKNAFGTDEITSVHLLKALSQFMLLCVSSQSKYDSVSQNLTTFSNDEKVGYEIYKQKCSSCHPEPLFTDFSFRNNGLSISEINDMGRYNITLLPEDKYRFKTPSLRNLYYTAPYMHDGRLLNLEAVLTHYNEQVQQTPNLDPILASNQQLGIPLTANEQKMLLRFLNTLNDISFISNKQLSEQ